MLCYVTLRYVILCRVMLCYAMLCCAVSMLCNVMLCYVMLCHVMTICHCFRCVVPMISLYVSCHYIVLGIGAMSRIVISLLLLLSVNPGLT